eukprot:1322597-Amorphochlora_amoeboformis.AAC.4
MEAEMLQAPDLPVSEGKVEVKESKKVEAKEDILAELAAAPAAPSARPKKQKTEKKKQDAELDAVTASLGI